MNHLLASGLKWKDHNPFWDAGFFQAKITSLIRPLAIFPMAFKRAAGSSGLFSSSVAEGAILPSLLSPLASPSSLILPSKSSFTSFGSSDCTHLYLRSDNHIVKSLKLIHTLCLSSKKTSWLETEFCISILRFTNIPKLVFVHIAITDNIIIAKIKELNVLG